MSYNCRFCSYRTQFLKDHLDHHRYHRNLSGNFHCGYNDCTEYFNSAASLRMHLIRIHNVLVTQTRVESQSHTIANEFSKFVCNVDICKKEQDDYRLLLKHLKVHISEGTSIQCPFPACSGKGKYSSVNSFTGHLSKYHKKVEMEVPSNAPYAFEECDMEENEDQNIVQSSSEVERMQTDLYLNNVAQLYLKLEAEFMLPASTIQYLIEELSNIERLSRDEQQNILENILGKEEILSSNSVKMIRNVFQNSPLLQSYDKLNTNHKRKKFYKDSFAFVEPKQKPLPKVKGKIPHFHYVPIIETIKAMFKDKSLQPIPLVSPCLTDDVLRDFTDGTVFQSNDFFKNNPETIKIILYQDSFEIVNPIGPAKGKYKMLAVYLSLGNLSPYLRSHINTIQLVALCREKTFDHAKVYGTIVEDIKKIETEGIEISPGQFVKGSVVFISGDNLGSHGLGGFVENFSKSKFFCRYCLIERGNINEYERAHCEHETNELDGDKQSENADEEEEIDLDDTREDSSDCSSTCSELDDSSCDGTDIENSDEENAEKIVQNMYFWEPHKKRTVESYQEALKHIEPGKNYQGIKFDSVFNSLKYYHVCKPGLAPCCGHDLLEGVLAKDIPLFTKYFIDKGWFTYSDLNHRIENFNYSTSDRRDKPVRLPDKCIKLTGGAWQNWTFLRLYPLLIGDKIQDTDDEVWLSLLNLSEIVEIIFAPEIHKSSVAYLQLIINDYLISRAGLFPSQKLLPKHHFLSHYPKLILEFGPLLRVWTLRFESKHTFFKRFTRVLGNFKNVTLSLSVKHELFQSLLRQGSDLRKIQNVEGERLFHPTWYCNDIQTALRGKGLRHDTMECTKAVIRGISYKVGDVLVLRQEHYQFNVEMGRISLILYDCNEKISFLLEVLKTNFKPRFRVYQLGSVLRYECIPVEELLSYEPLHVYTVNTVLKVRLKHGLVGYEM